MRAVKHYELAFYLPTTIYTPASSQMLVACHTDDGPRLWVLEPIDEPCVERKVNLFRQGEPIPPDARYISSFNQNYMTVHAFEVTP
jgi:hypothetical protein